MLSKNFIRTAIFACTLSMFGIALADSVPVVNAYQYESNNNGSGNNNNFDNQDNQNSQYMQDNQNNMYTPPPQYLTTSQRLSKLEAQVGNLQSMNLLTQIQQLQQQMEKLQGQLQVQSHELKLMKAAMASKKLFVTQSGQLNNQQPQSSQTDNTAVVNTTTAVSTPSNGSGFLNDQNAYQSAYNLIAASKYPAATTAMQSYIQQYPNGKYVSNAYYWLGELYLLQNNSAAASKSFQTVISKYPNSDKLQDAMLKLGLIYYDNGQLSLAKIQLQKVVKSYPNTTVARLASARLLDINQQTSSQQTSPAQTNAQQANTQQTVSQTNQTTQPSD